MVLKPEIFLVKRVSELRKYLRNLSKSFADPSERYNLEYQLVFTIQQLGAHKHEETVAKVLEDELVSADVDTALDLLRTVDKVLRRIGGKILSAFEPFLPEIVQQISSLLIQAKQTEKTVELLMLRDSWIGFYSFSTLHTLDHLVKNVHSAWPMFSPKRTGDIMFKLQCEQCREPTLGLGSPESRNSDLRIPDTMLHCRHLCLKRAAELEEYLKNLKTPLSIVSQYSHSLVDLLVLIEPLLLHSHSETIAKIFQETLMKADVNGAIGLLDFIQKVLREIGKKVSVAFEPRLPEIFKRILNLLRKAGRTDKFDDLLMLRLQWEDLFSINVLHALDRVVHEIDSSWPLFDSSKSSQVPKMLSAMKSDSSAGWSVQVAPQVPSTTINYQKKKIEVNHKSEMTHDDKQTLIKSVRDIMQRYQTNKSQVQLQNPAKDDGKKFTRRIPNGQILIRFKIGKEECFNRVMSKKRMSPEYRDDGVTISPKRRRTSSTRKL